MAAEARPKDGLRCYHCTGPLSKDMGGLENAGNERWELAAPDKRQLLMIGSALGGTASAFYGFNRVVPFVHRWVKGPLWLHSLIGVIGVLTLMLFRAPPVIVFSSICAGLTGGAVPAIAQLASSTYHAAVSSHLPPSSTEDDKMHTSRASSTL